VWYSYEKGGQHTSELNSEKTKNTPEERNTRKIHGLSHAVASATIRRQNTLRYKRPDEPKKAETHLARAGREIIND